MDRKQKLELFENYYAAERTAAMPYPPDAQCFYRGVSMGWLDALLCLGLFSEYEKWKSQQEG